MSLFTLVILACISGAFSQSFSTGSNTNNTCGNILAVPANATGVQSLQSSSSNGLGQWRVAVSTNLSAATIENGRNLTETSPGAVANVWLDPFDGVDLTDGNNDFSACAYIFKGLPENTILRGQDDDTSCTQMFSQNCVTALNWRAAETAKWLVNNPTQGPHSNLTPPVIEPICQDILQGIGRASYQPNPLPSECLPFFDTGHSLYPTADVLVLTSNSTKPLNCSFHNSVDGGSLSFIEDYNVPPGVRYPFNSTNGSAVASYDELVHQVFPILTVTFAPANNSRSNPIPRRSVASMTCVRAGNVKAYSWVPTALPAAQAVNFSSTLSKAAIAGIVVGSVVGVAIIAAVLWWVWRRHQKRKVANHKNGDVKGIVSTQTHEKDMYQLDSRQKPELGGSQPAELAGESTRVELAGNNTPPHELAAGTPIQSAR